MQHGDGLEAMSIRERLFKIVEDGISLKPEKVAHKRLRKAEVKIVSY
jgi:hypothetical protein